MKQLLWKEWREKRLLVLICPAFVVTWIVGTALGVSWPYEPRYFAGMFNTALACSYFLGIFAGCDAFSSEVGSGTLQFLTGLPIPRQRIWAAKLTAAMAVLLAAWGLMSLILGAFALFIMHGRNHEWSTAYEPGFWLTALATAGCTFTVASAVSPLVDRPAASALIAAVASAVLFTLTAPTLYAIAASHPNGAWSDAFRWHVNEVPFFACGIGVSLACLTASYQTFTRGETLRTPQRFTITGGILAGWAIVLMVALHIARMWS